MPIRNRIEEAKRNDPYRTSKGRHPMLAMGSRHLSIWQTLVDATPKGGLTRAQLDRECGVYHPQVLSDLLDARLVKTIGKRGGQHFYVADINGKGIRPQRVTIEIELFEDENGALFTRTRLMGRVSNNGKIKKFLAKRKVTMLVPLLTDPQVTEVFGEVTIDQDPDILQETYTQRQRSNKSRQPQEEPCVIEGDYVILKP